MFASVNEQYNDAMLLSGLSNSTIGAIMLKVIGVSYFGQEGFQALSLASGFAPSMLNQSYVLALQECE